MGGSDHCAVWGCDNDRRYPERWIVKDHVKDLKFHSCQQKNQVKWTELLHRSDFKVTSTTKVCSNHFQYAQPFKTDPNPSLFLKGYDVSPATPRRTPIDRTNIHSTPRRPRPRRFQATGVQVEASQTSIGIQVNLSDFHDEHEYALPPSSSYRQVSQTYVAHLEKELDSSKLRCDELLDRLQTAKENVRKLEKDLEASSNKMTISDISGSDELIKLYTGIPSYGIFKWLFSEVAPHAQNLHYFKGKSSLGDKSYQINNHKKPGPKRAQTLEDELLMTLMKLRLNLREDDLAFRFGIGQSTVSQVLSTWLPFLQKELDAFINWPSKEATLKYYPACFHKYKGTVRCIIDCTEIQIERPSLAASNTQVYSQYKSRPTVKCLVGITPSGAISFVSKPVGGNTSDKKIVKMSGLVDLFEPGDLCMADRGFNIQELLLHKQVRLIIPPFQRTTKSTSQFTELEDNKTKTVANARIHVERAIGRLKEFSILQGPIPLTMVDLMESALVVCSAIANLQPVLVPLTS
ncbi:LOW QUALITY PROTEIN: uncharacterized protein [Amphiura filiformis]|uniref:LOW QUALITY PROTEIN: uncharacterized protein n=1 Tax=Amphiura filiformis TaxID=82378 RepID=UPI003B21BAB8